MPDAAAVTTASVPSRVPCVSCGSSTRTSKPAAVIASCQDFSSPDGTTTDSLAPVALRPVTTASGTAAGLARTTVAE